MRNAVLFLSVALAAVAIWWYAHDEETRGRTTVERDALSSGQTGSANPRDRQPEASPPKANHHLIGRVVAGAPAQGVSDVTVSANDASTRTDDKGRYRLGLLIPKGGFARWPVLRAEAADGRSALARALLRQDGIETTQPDLVLAQSQEVTLRVTRQDGEAVPGADIALVRLRRHPRMPQSPPARSALTEHRTGARGTVSLRLAAGEYEAVASAEQFGRTVARFELPRDDDTITIILADEWRVKILVRDRKSGAPVPGATVRAFSRYQKYGIPNQVTDAHGEAELRGLNARDKVLVDALAPGEVPQEERPGPPVRRRHPIPAGAREMVIEIDLPRIISWEVLDGDISAPPDGTIIRLSSSPGTIMSPPPQGIMRNGRLVAAGWPPMAAHALAHGPERTMARLFAKQGATEGRPFAFKRFTTLTLVLRNADGTRAAGEEVALLNPGNIPILQAKTDESGVVRMEELFGGLANLILIRSHRYDRQPIGTVDLNAGRDVRIDYTLPAHREVEFRVTVGGKPGLPDGCRLWLPGLVLRDREEDRERGIVRGRVFIPPGTGKTLQLSLVAAGYVDTYAEIPIPEGHGPIRHTFDLKRGLACRIRLLGQPARQHYGLQRFDFLQRTEDGWRLVDSPDMVPQREQRKTEDGYIYDGLAPGKYVMQAQRSGVILGAAEVRSGPTPVITVDCTRFGVVSGHVKVPDGFELRSVRIKLAGDGIIRPRSEGSPARFDRRDGSFVVGVPGDRRVRIQATHNVLAQHRPQVHLRALAARGDRLLGTEDQAQPVEARQDDRGDGRNQAANEGRAGLDKTDGRGIQDPSAGRTFRQGVVPSTACPTQGTSQ